MLAELADIATGGADLEVATNGFTIAEEFKRFSCHLLLLSAQRWQSVGQHGEERRDLGQATLDFAVDGLVVVVFAADFADQVVELVLRIEMEDHLQETEEGVARLSAVEDDVEFRG